MLAAVRARESRTIAQLQALIEKQQFVECVDQPGINFHYVAREVLPIRTSLHARFEDARGSDSRGADSTLADLLLRRAAGNAVFAIVAEIKIRNDKNPVTALIQALMHASELVTPNQLRRLRRWYSELGTCTQRVDLAVLLYKYDDDPRPGRKELLRISEHLCRALIDDWGVSQHLRVISFLDVRFNPAIREISCSTRFSYGN